ncbi:MAG: hypothetical protein ACRCVT_06750, partial [Leadbetterella sp.]
NGDVVLVNDATGGGTTAPIDSTLRKAIAVQGATENYGTNQKIQIQTNGNIGIGTTSPQYKLQVGGTDASISLAPDQTSQNRSINFVASGSSNIPYATISSNSTLGDLQLKSGSTNSGAGFTMSFHTDNTERMRILSNGNVGIGLTSPANVLSVSRNQTSPTSISVSNNGTVGANTIMQFLLSEDASTTHGYFRRYRDGTGLTEIGFTDNLAFATGVSGTKAEKMRILSNGNVGIGIATPEKALHVIGDVKVSTLSSSTVTANRMVVTDQYGVLSSQAIPAMAAADNMGNHTAAQNIALNGYKLTNNGSGGGINITNTGNVGIGTNTPNEKFVVESATNRRLNIGGGTSSTLSDFGVLGSAITFSRPSDGVDGISGIYNYASTVGLQNLAIGSRSDLVFATGGPSIYSSSIERMRVLENGNVGIGTSNPSAKLQIITGSSSGQVLFGFGGNSQTYIDQDAFIVRSGDGLSNKISSSNGSNALYGYTYVAPYGTTGNAGSIGFSPGSATTTGYMGIYKANNARLGYIGFDNTNLSYVSENGANHTFLGGNVGIGTSNPLYKLDVGGNINASGYLSHGTGSDGYYGFGLSSPSNNLDPQDLDYNRAGTNPIYRINHHSGLSISAHSYYGGIRFYNQGYTNTTTNPYLNAAGSTMVMAINNNSVGIGTTNPSALLHLGGSSNKGMRINTATNNASFFGGWQDQAVISVNRNAWDGAFTDATKAAASIQLEGNSTGSTIQFYTTETVNTLQLERMRIIPNGNVGIGIGTPASKLHVVGETKLDGNLTVGGNSDGSLSYISMFYNRSSTDPNFTGLRSSNSSGWTEWRGANNRIVIRESGYFDIVKGANTADGTNVSNLMRIQASTGNVGIGTTGEPQNKLEVYKAGVSGLRLKGLASASNAGKSLIIDANGDVDLASSVSSSSIDSLKDALVYHNGCIDPSIGGGVVIKTKIPFTNHVMGNITIEGYNYGAFKSFELKINYYTYKNSESTPWFFHSGIVSSSGAYNPTIKLFNDNGLVSIFIERGLENQYCLNFKVKSWNKHSGDNLSWHRNWSASLVNADPTLSLATENKINLTYKNNFNGNVGIGTDSPISPLHVMGGSAMTQGWNKTLTLQATYPTILFNSNSQKWGGIGYDFSSNMNFWVGGSSDELATTATAAISIAQNGYVGMGTTAPEAKLDIKGTGYVMARIASTNDQANLSLKGTFGQIENNTGDFFITNSGANGSMIFRTTTTERMRINSIGQVIIGIPVNLPSSDYKLAVAGNIIAEKIKVKNKSSWPDFVFEKSYKLQPLEEVEQYIQANKHLPEIPSAAEVAKEGQDVGEMNRLLLKKVEELTLYLIELEKKNKELNGRVEKLENK